VGYITSLPTIMPNIWPLGLFLLAVLVIALARYRETLDRTRCCEQSAC
jgi:hypothetical protein